MFVDWHAHNRHWFNGEFQFAVINGFNGRVFGRAPREQDAGCAFEDISPCITNPAMILDERTVRGALGEPQEIVECAGVGFYHYDPPIRLDFSGLPDPNLAPIGRTVLASWRLKNARRSRAARPPRAPHPRLFPRPPPARAGKTSRFPPWARWR